MAGRRKTSDVTVDIFFFLGVVKNLLGVLLVIIIALALGATEAGRGKGQGGKVSAEEILNEGEAATQPAKKRPDAKMAMKGYEGKDVQELVELIAQAVVVQKLVAASANHPDPVNEDKELQKQVDDLLQEVVRLRAETKNLPIPGAGLAAYQLAGGSSTRTFNAAFVECSEQALMLHPTAESVAKSSPGIQQNLFVVEESLERVFARDIDKRPRFRNFLAELKKNNIAGVVFLIRPDGVRTFRAAERVAQEMGIRSEMLAIPGFGPIDLGQFGGGKK